MYVIVAQAAILSFAGMATTGGWLFFVSFEIGIGIY